ncbi:MAG: hypothetical protein JSW26_09475, partial [Desulfobacterales bacterium]
MKEKSNLPLFSCYLKIFAFSLTMLVWGAVSQAAELNARHHIQIELIPDESKLIGKDDIAIKANGSQTLVFRLSENLTQIKVDVDGNPQDFDFKGGRLLI